jgi:hypothetical protein
MRDDGKIKQGKKENKKGDASKKERVTEIGKR